MFKVWAETTVEPISLDRTWLQEDKKSTQWVHASEKNISLTGIRPLTTHVLGARNTRSHNYWLLALTKIFQTLMYLPKSRKKTHEREITLKNTLYSCMTQSTYMKQIGVEKQRDTACILSCTCIPVCICITQHNGLNLLFIMFAIDFTMLEYPSFAKATQSSFRLKEKEFSWPSLLDQLYPCI